MPADVVLVLQPEDFTRTDPAAAEWETGVAHRRVDLRAEASRSVPWRAGAPSAVLCPTQAIMLCDGCRSALANPR